jgi:tetratricopeptide (TPR) repeat protein
MMVDACSSCKIKYLKIIFFALLVFSLIYPPYQIAWLTNLGYIQAAKGVIGKDNDYLIKSELSFSKINKMESNNDNAQLGLIFVRLNFDPTDHFNEIAASITKNLNKPKTIFLLQWIIQASENLEQNGEIEKSIQVVKLLDYAAFPGFSLIQLGQIYEKVGYLGLAERVYKQATALPPKDSSKAYILLGNLYLSQNKWAEAKNAYLSSIKVYPEDDYYGYWGMGMIALTTGNPVPWFLKAAQVTSSSHLKFMAYLYVGQIYGAWCGDHCDYHMAEKFYELALMQQTTDASAFNQARAGLEIARQKIAQGLP